MTEIKVGITLKGRVRVEVCDGEKVPDYSTYLALKESGELWKYVIQDQECDV